VWFEVTWSFANLTHASLVIYSLIIYGMYLNIRMFHGIFIWICASIFAYIYIYIYIYICTHTHIHLYLYALYEHMHNITPNKWFHLDSLLKIFVSEWIWRIDNVFHNVLYMSADPRKLSSRFLRSIPNVCYLNVVTSRVTKYGKSLA